MSPIRVALIEDEAGFAHGIRCLLENSPGFKFIEWYDRGQSALKGLNPSDVDVVAVDLHLPDVDGVECIRQLGQREPPVPCLVLSKFGESDKIFAAFCAGARGYVLKSDGGREFLDAVEAVHDGKIGISPAIASRAIELLKSLVESPLTERESTILKLAERRLDNKQIADELGISYKTVANHLTTIFRKLRVSGKGRKGLGSQ